MSQNLENNKLIAAVLVAGIIAMFSGFIAKQLVHPTLPEKAALEIDTSALETAAAGSDAPVGPEPILGLLAKADTAKGGALSKACLACHSFDKGGPNKVGPNLYGIVNNKKAHAAGFPYSDTITAMAAKGDHWTYDNLNHFLWKPNAYAKGTKMTYPGLKKAQDRADVIAYLRTLADAPAALPTDAEIAADAPKDEPAKDAKPGAPVDTKAEGAKPADKTADTGTKPADEKPAVSEANKDVSGEQKTTDNATHGSEPTAPSVNKPGVVTEKAAAPMPESAK